MQGRSLRSIAWRPALATCLPLLAAIAVGPAAAVAAGTPAPGAPIPPPTLAESERGASADSPDAFVPKARALGAPTIPTGKWVPLGPAAIGPSGLGAQLFGGVNAGRITAIAVIPFGSHQGRAIAATASGGIWTSDNEGKEWKPRTDSAEDLSMGSVTVDQSDPALLIAGTGEANQCGDCYPGTGVLVSSDSGVTWTVSDPGGIFSGLDIGSVAIDPHNQSHWFAAVYDPAGEGRGGLYVTGDGGKSWSKPTDSSYAPLDGNMNSVVINPTKPVTVYIGGGPKLVGESTDGGTTWKAVSTGIAVPEAGPLHQQTVALAIAATNTNILYASVGSETEPAALYKTTSGGSSWTKFTNVPDYTGQLYSYGAECGESEQGWYDNLVTIDPFNASVVFVGGIALLETADGGNSWVNVNENASNSTGKFKGGGRCELSLPSIIHPDQHAVTFNANGNAWIGDDGGAFLDKINPDEGMHNANGNLDITQIYKGFNDVLGEILVGTQDNASASVALPAPPALPVPWTAVAGGDGGSSAITPNETSTRFIEADQALFVTNNGFASTPREITPQLGKLFVPPILVVPNSTEPTKPTLFYGSEDLFRTTDPSAIPVSWQRVTFEEGKVSALAGSKDGKTIYAGFADGTIEVSTDGGETFTAIAAEPFTEQFVTGISVNPSNPKEIVASFSFSDTRKRPGFPHVATYSFSSEPGSGTWTTITGNLPAFAVSRVVYFDGTLLAAATDRGVYVTAEPAGAATEWSRLGSELPNVQVQDLDPEPGGLFAVTHGRGAWELPSPVKLPIDVCTVDCFIKVLLAGGPVEQHVRVLFDGVTVATGVTSKEGKLSLRVEVPASAAPGSHAIEVLDEHGTGGGASFVVRTDWGSARSDAGQTGFVPHENVLSPTDLGNLHQRAAPQWGAFTHSAPIYAAGELYAASDDGSVRAFNPISGLQLWSFAAQGAIDGSPVAVPAVQSSPLNKGCAIIAASGAGSVYGLDPGTGAQLWSFGAGAAVDSSPVVFLGKNAAGKAAYHVAVTTSSGGVDVLDACTGALVWSTSAAALGPARTPAVIASVRLSDGTVHTLVVVAFNAGVVEALDAATGATLWSHSAGGSITAPSAFSATGVGQRIALANGSSVQELSASTGTLIWSTDTHSPIDGGVAVQAGPGTGTPGTVFAVNEAGQAFALAAKTGAALWSAPVSGPAPVARSAPTLANGVLYLVSAPPAGAAGELQALAASNGAALFSTELGAGGDGSIETGPAVADGRVVSGDFSGGIRIFGL